jgi:hypothetical protein
MQMELAHRDGVLIPEQKVEPEDPKRPDELLAADRGGLVFVAAETPNGKSGKILEFRKVG